jgi:EAL domain-containing protein (putative c-di-GMP-specific phosphodiesterase class I)
MSKALSVAPRRRLRPVGLLPDLDLIRIEIQPIIDLATAVPVAVEALARFPGRLRRSPEDIIADAHAAGRGVEVEAACLRAALAVRDRLPAGVLLSVNVSPDVLQHALVEDSWPRDLDGVIIEVTEHLASDPTALSDHIAHFRRRGAAIAVDDVSTGYAGLLRLATLRPDYVKIDRQIVAGVRDSVAQTAVLEALVGLSHRLGASVIAEGVESIDDLNAIAEFDVDLAQGYAVGRPADQLEPIATLVTQTCLAGRRRLLRQPALVGRTAGHTRVMHGVTAAVARAEEQSDLHQAIARAASQLGVDTVGVSVLGPDDTLREIASSADSLDPNTYHVAEFPATQQAMATGSLFEAHLNDPGSDAAEQDLLAQLGHASLLLVPVIEGTTALGVLEFAHRTTRRWSTQDIAHARGLAEHLAGAISRVQANLA